jgi:hypothetical protein
VSPIAPALDFLGAKVGDLTALVAQRVNVEAMMVTDRLGHLSLDPPGLRSPNRACGLVETCDGWIAVNLARDEDRELVPAWLHCEPCADPWPAIARLSRMRTCDDLISDATLLSLPVSRVGEIASDTLEPPALALGAAAPVSRSRAPEVIDLSAMWAGPLCGAILAEMGASVARIESLSRPDPSRTATPEFYRRLNWRKSELRLDFSREEERRRLRDMVLESDVLITSARPRAFSSLGFSPESVFAVNPHFVWVAITGYGWVGRQSSRVAFGDDAAAAGGLVRWSSDGEPRFLGDALADPVTGLGASIGALRALSTGGGVLVDAALARCASSAARLCGFRKAA